MILYHSNRVQIFYDEADKILIYRALDYGIESEIKQGMENLLQHLKQHKLNAVLLDLSEWLTGLPDGIEQWLLFDFAPRCILANLEVIAVVAPKDPSSHFETRQLIEKVKEAFSIKFFKNIQYAQRWLTNKTYYSPVMPLYN